MQPRRCGAVDLRAWRTDRKRPVWSSLRFRPGACVPRPRALRRQEPIPACVPQRGRLRTDALKAFGESSKSQLPLSQDQGLFRTRWSSTTIQPRHTSWCFSARLRGHATIRQDRWLLACSMKIRALHGDRQFILHLSLVQKLIKQFRASFGLLYELSDCF
jgi:hypothetical protein